ncbi:MAG: DUF2735 domain-containing protein [Pseudolabrys sp.]|nr:DUF2735 domain-containing protein [Pseudolabrys sp.]
MDRILNQATATIYQFPMRGRFAATVHDEFAQVRESDIALVDCWYHDEAVREETKKVQ